MSDADAFDAAAFYNQNFEEGLPSLNVITVDDEDVGLGNVHIDDMLLNGKVILIVYSKY